MTPRLRADQIQPRDDAARLAAESAERAVAILIGRTLAAFAEAIDESTVARLIETNSFTELWDHLALERLTPALRPALNRLALVHDRAAIAATLAIPESAIIRKAAPSRLRTPAVINLTYDPLNAATVAAQNATNARIAANIERTATDTVEQVISDGLIERRDPRAIVRRLRETLGMSPAEAAAIDSYRTALAADRSGALARELRDPRFDGRIREGSLSASEIDRMAARYAQRYRAYRALRLARTETMRAANQGRAAAWRQYAALTGRDYRRFWLTAGDELVCAVCAPIPGMNQDGIGPDEKYATPKGPVDAPPDPHPSCRCSERFDRISGVSEPDSASSSGVGLRIEFDYGQ